MKPRQVIPLLIVAAGLWAYHNSFQGPFIFDDVTSIAENPHIHHLWPVGVAMSAPPNCTVAGRPVVCLSLALNYALGGSDVQGYHVFNLTVHVLSALVLFGILRRTFEGGKIRERFGGAAVWLAAVIALVWEVHPLQTESVDYIVQRTELLMGLFLLLTLYCFIRGVASEGENPKTGDRNPKPISQKIPKSWYAISVLSCALGMGSKEVMVGAPLIVLLYDRVFLASSFRELWRRRMGLYLGLAATWLLLALLVARTSRPMTRFEVEGLTPGDYLMTEAGVIIHYLRLCFWPHPLVIDYADWPRARSLEDGLVPGVAVLGLLGATVWALRRRLGFGFLGAWFFLILGPTSSILPSAGEVAAERRMYLPLAAVVTMVVVGVFVLGRQFWSKGQGRALGWVASVFMVVLFTVLTIQRNEDYRSALAIWQDTVEKRPNNPRAHGNLGYALYQQGELQGAIAQSEQAVRISPNYAEAHNNLATALLQAGKLQGAIEEWEQAVQVKPDHVKAQCNLGNALLRVGKVQQAVGHFEQALRVDPRVAEAHYGLGLALTRLGRLPEAIHHYEQALRSKPDYAEAHTGLGVALVKLGRMPEAIEHWVEALRISPDSAEAHVNLGVALERLGRTAEAVQHYKEALRIKPDLVQARNALARARAGLGSSPPSSP